MGKHWQPKDEKWALIADLIEELNIKDEHEQERMSAALKGLSKDALGNLRYYIQELKPRRA